MNKKRCEQPDHFWREGPAGHVVLGGEGAAGPACGLISAAAAPGILAGAGTTHDSLEKGRSEAEVVSSWGHTGHTGTDVWAMMVCIPKQAELEGAGIRLPNRGKHFVGSGD